MARALITIRGKDDRDRAAKWAQGVPTGTRIEFKETKRSLPQNDLMWSLLTEVARQKEHAGRKYTPDEWKTIFMHAWGREVQFVPSLDHKTFIPFAARSSDLSKGEMTELIEFILCWCAENGVEVNLGSEAA